MTGLGTLNFKFLPGDKHSCDSHNDTTSCKKKTSIERFNKQVINLHILKQFVIIVVILFLNLQATSSACLQLGVMPLEKVR